MQQLTDLRKQAAATAARPLGLRTWYERVWGLQTGNLGDESAFLREKLDNSYMLPIQDLDPGSGTFGQYIGAYENPFNRGPI